MLKKKSVKNLTERPRCHERVVQQAIVNDGEEGGEETEHAHKRHLPLLKLFIFIYLIDLIYLKGAPKKLQNVHDVSFAFIIHQSGRWCSSDHSSRAKHTPSVNFPIPPALAPS